MTATSAEKVLAKHHWGQMHHRNRGAFSPEQGSPPAGRARFSSHFQFSSRGRDRSNPRYRARLLKRSLPIRGRILHFLVMRDRLPSWSKCSIVSKTGAHMRNVLPLPRTPTIPSTGRTLSGAY